MRLGSRAPPSRLSPVLELDMGISPTGEMGDAAFLERSDALDAVVAGPQIVRVPSPVRSAIDCRTCSTVLRASDISQTRSRPWPLDNASRLVLMGPSPYY